MHVSSYFLLDHTLGPGLAGLFAAARTAGAVTSLDTNWDPAGGWGGAQLRDVLAQTSLLLPNEGEALRISGAPDLDTAAGVLTSWGPDLVVKLGARGALCAQGPRWHRAELAPVTPVDATGAGDCFNAGLIAGLAQGLAAARGGPARLRHRRAVHPRRGRHDQRPDPGRGPRPGPDSHRPSGLCRLSHAGCGGLC